MSWTNESWPLCLSHFTGVSMLSDLQAVPKKGGLLFWSIFKYYLILVLSIQVGIFRWNAQPFKAGIANQIFIWVHLYLSCWMGACAWWYGSDLLMTHNDLLSCFESFQGWFDLVKSKNSLKIWLAIPALNGRPFKAGMVDYSRMLGDLNNSI